MSQRRELISAEEWAVGGGVKVGIKQTGNKLWNVQLGEEGEGGLVGGQERGGEEGRDCPPG